MLRGTTCEDNLTKKGKQLEKAQRDGIEERVFGYSDSPAVAKAACTELLTGQSGIAQAMK